MTWFERTHGTNNPKTSNPEELNLFEYAAIKRRTQWSYECHQGKWYNRKYSITWKFASNYIRQNVVPSVHPSGVPISITSYVTIINQYIPPSEKTFRSLQERKRTTLKKVKDLENNIASEEINLYEADQLQELYIIKFKRGICMLETNF